MLAAGEQYAGNLGGSKADTECVCAAASPCLQGDSHIKAQVVVGGCKVQRLGEGARRLWHLIRVILRPAHMHSRDQMHAVLSQTPPAPCTRSSTQESVHQLATCSPGQIQHDHSIAVVVKLAQGIFVHLNCRGILLLCQIHIGQVDPRVRHAPEPIACSRGLLNLR